MIRLILWMYCAQALKQPKASPHNSLTSHTFDALELEDRLAAQIQSFKSKFPGGLVLPNNVPMIPPDNTPIQVAQPRKGKESRVSTGTLEISWTGRVLIFLIMAVIVISVLFWCDVVKAKAVWIYESAFEKWLSPPKPKPFIPTMSPVPRKAKSRTQAKLGMLQEHMKKERIQFEKTRAMFEKKRTMQLNSCDHKSDNSSSSSETEHSTSSDDIPRNLIPSSGFRSYMLS